MVLTQGWLFAEKLSFLRFWRHLAAFERSFRIYCGRWKTTDIDRPDESDAPDYACGTDYDDDTYY